MCPTMTQIHQQLHDDLMHCNALYLARQSPVVSTLAQQRLNKTFGIPKLANLSQPPAKIADFNVRDGLQ